MYVCVEIKWLQDLEEGVWALELELQVVIWLYMEAVGG